MPRPLVPAGEAAYPHGMKKSPGTKSNDQAKKTAADELKRRSKQKIKEFEDSDKDDPRRDRRELPREPGRSEPR